MKESILKVKKKKEFSGLPDSVVERALGESDNDVKSARVLLRKYFGAFLTNRVLKGSGNKLGVHLSSKKRDYEKFYSRIFEDIGKVSGVVDLGCGANGFSYEFLPDGVEYVGVEAAGQLVEQMNVFFEERAFDAISVRLDLFDMESVLDILKKVKKPRVVFMFQIVDALESMERNFSKKLIGKIMEESEVLVVNLPLVSFGGRKRFTVDRKWLLDFLKADFVLDDDFEMFGERVLIIKKR